MAVSGAVRGEQLVLDDSTAPEQLDLTQEHLGGQPVRHGKVPSDPTQPVAR